MLKSIVPNNRLVRMAAGWICSGYIAVNNQIIYFSDILLFIAATAQPCVNPQCDEMKAISIIGISLFLPMCIVFGQTLGTAAEYFTKADSVADAWLETPRLLEIEADTVDIDGKSSQWIFGFDSLMLTINRDTVITDTSFHWLTGMALITGHWMDSDSAMIIAEKEGGREFRQDHGSSIISAWLIHNSASLWSEWVIRYQSITNPQVMFRICFDALDGSDIYTYYSAVQSEPDEYGFQLHQNYPNPFNAETKIVFTLPSVSEVNLNIYNINGETVYHTAGMFDAGKNEISWIPGSISTGIYWYEIICNSRRFQSSMIYLK